MRERLLDHLIAPPRPDQTGGASRCDDSLDLHVFKHRDEHIEHGVLAAGDGRWWWIADGIPRMLPPDMYRRPDLEGRHAARLTQLGLDLPRSTSRSTHGIGRIQRDTIDRFGAEWRHFRDWGYHEQAPDGDDTEYQGGLWSHTRHAFRIKTFLDGRLDGRLALDAGCGNGRFTAAALDAGAREVIAMDLGWGVEAAHDRHRADPRVHVVQGDLFALPIRRVEVAFSIGVLMHTGHAERALASIAHVIEPGGSFAVRMYHRGNPVYEFVDRTIRRMTTSLSKPAQIRLASMLAGLGRRLIELDDGVPGSPRRMRIYQVLRNWPTQHHNLDWWTAPVASHHTVAEVADWGRATGLSVARTEPAEQPERYPFWQWPETVTVLFERPEQAA